jgi:hypothetical protein
MVSTAVYFWACGGVSFYRQSWFGKQQVCSQDGEQPMGNTHCRSAAGRRVPCHGVHPHRNIQIVSISITLNHCKIRVLLVSEANESLPFIWIKIQIPPFCKIWGSHSSFVNSSDLGIWRSVVGQVVSNASKDHSAFILIVKWCKKNLFCPTTWLLRRRLYNPLKCKKLLPTDMVSICEDMNLHHCFGWNRFYLFSPPMSADFQPSYTVFSSFVSSHVLNTRWFKYDRDWLRLVYTQIVPVIFEPPCIYRGTFCVFIEFWLVPSKNVMWHLGAYVSMKLLHHLSNCIFSLCLTWFVVQSSFQFCIYF